MAEDIKTKAENFLKDQDLPEKISTFPSLILKKAQLLSDLEAKIGEAKQKATKAVDESNKLKGYEEKKFLWFKYKSGKTKKIIKDTQGVLKSETEATKLNSNAIELSIQFEKELATTMEFLFYLGCYNLATNEAMVASLNEQLNGELKTKGGEKIKLSKEVKEQFKTVVKRLMAQHDVLYRQEKIKKKSKKHGQAIARNINEINELKDSLSKKESLDAEQSALIEEIKKSLEEKDKIDSEQSLKIEKLLNLLEEKDVLDKKQSDQIEHISMDYMSILEVIGDNKKKQTIINWFLGIIATMGIILSLFAIF